jgi:F0F1-type ATP synthase assembly protein I
VKKGVAWSLAWTLSWTILFSLLIPLLGGIWLDKKLGTTPLFVLIGAVIGILAATLGIARLVISTFPVAAGASKSEAGENDEEEPE